MGTAIGLRNDFDATTLRALARGSKKGPQARRLLVLAAIYDGASRSEAAKIGGMTLQIVRDWVLRFNEHGPDGLLDRKVPGQPSIMKDEHRAALARMVEDGPTPAIHRVVRCGSSISAAERGGPDWRAPSGMMCGWRFR